MENQVFRRVTYVNSKTVSLVCGAVVAATFVNQLTQLIAFWTSTRRNIRNDGQDEEELEQLKKMNYICTKEWVASHEHENALLININEIPMSHALAKSTFHQLYPINSDILGIRSVGPFLNIIFANRSLVDQALLDGFRMKRLVTVHPTKVLDAAYHHTLLTFIDLPICKPDTTKEKIEQSLAPLFEKKTISDELPGRQSWPPLIHDFLFHRQSTGYYTGNVTVILRGKVAIPYHKLLHLDGFGQMIKCHIETVTAI